MRRLDGGPRQIVKPGITAEPFFANGEWWNRRSRLAGDETFDPLERGGLPPLCYLQTAPGPSAGIELLLLPSLASRRSGRK
jgi:hypothetical protein